jgi:hypothetical protein
MLLDILHSDRHSITIMSEGLSAVKDRPTALDRPEAVIREARRRTRRRRLGVAAMVVVLIASGVVAVLATRPTEPPPTAAAHPLAQPATPPDSSSAGTISGQVFIGRTEPIGIPNATLTLRSQGDLTRTIKTSSNGLFRVAVPPGKWTVARLAPAVLDQLCVTPTTVKVVASHRTAIQVQVACARSIGGGYFAPSG